MPDAAPARVAPWTTRPTATHRVGTEVRSMRVPTSGEPIMATHMTMVTMSSAAAPPPAHSGAKVSTDEWTAKKSIQVIANAAREGDAEGDLLSLGGMTR